MIRPLAAHFQQLPPLVGASQCLDYGFPKILLGQVKRTGTAYQDSTRRQQTHSVLVYFFIGSQTGLQVLAFLDKGRRVEEHHVETRARLVAAYVWSLSNGSSTGAAKPQ